MPANSINWYVKSLLDGVTAPDFGPAQVYIAPPQGDPMTQPVISIWGTSADESRRTFPRVQAFKKVDWKIYLYVKAQFEAGHPRESSAFPLLLDAIKKVLRVTPILATYIYDPDTLERSQLISIGEDMHTDFPGAQESSNGFRLYQASIVCSATEDLTG